MYFFLQKQTHESPTQNLQERLLRGRSQFNVEITQISQDVWQSVTLDKRETKLQTDKQLPARTPTSGGNVGRQKGARERSSTTPVLFWRQEKRPKVWFLDGDAACVPPWAFGPNSTNRFSVKRSERTPAFPPLLLLLSGDIETNPGPYPCPSCNRPYYRQLGSIQCSACDEWTHYTPRCAGLRLCDPVPPGWVCRNCQPNHGRRLSPLQTYLRALLEELRHRQPLTESSG